MNNDIDPIDATELDFLIHSAHSVAKSKGFWDKARTPTELLMLIVTEFAEAAEELRKAETLGMDTIYYTPDSRKPEGFGIEIADATLRLFDLIGGFGIDIIVPYQQLSQVSDAYFEDINQLIVYSPNVSIDDTWYSGFTALEDVMHLVTVTVNANNEILLYPNVKQPVFAGKLAIILQYIFRISEKYRLDLHKALITKMDYNKTRDFMHGKSV